MTDFQKTPDDTITQKEPLKKSQKTLNRLKKMYKGSAKKACKKFLQKPIVFSS
jgi:hypothetical protein